MAGGWSVHGCHYHRRSSTRRVRLREVGQGDNLHVVSNSNRWTSSRTDDDARRVRQNVALLFPPRRPDDGILVVVGSAVSTEKVDGSALHKRGGGSATLHKGGRRVTTSFSDGALHQVLAPSLNKVVPFCLSCAR